MKSLSRGNSSGTKHVIHHRSNLSLSVYQGPSPEKVSKTKIQKKNTPEKAKSGGGGSLRQSKDQKYLQTGTGRPSPRSVLSRIGAPQVRVQYLFLRARRIQRGFWPVWSDPGHPLGHHLPTTPSFRPSGRPTECTVCFVCEKKHTQIQYRCVSHHHPPKKTRSCGSHMKFLLLGV